MSTRRLLVAGSILALSGVFAYIIMFILTLSEDAFRVAGWVAGGLLVYGGLFIYEGIKDRREGYR